MYGFSWGVVSTLIGSVPRSADLGCQVKTLAEAVVDQETITGPWDEDAKMGTMMVRHMSPFTIQSNSF